MSNNKRLHVALAFVLAAIVLVVSMLVLAVDSPRQAQAAPALADTPRPEYVLFNSAGFTASAKTSGHFLHEEYNVQEIVYSLGAADHDVVLTLQIAPDRQGPWLTQATWTYTAGQTPLANTYVLTYPKLRYSRWTMAHTDTTKAITPVIRSVYKYLPYEPTQ
jgi:hypothetical protein